LKESRAGCFHGERRLLEHASELGLRAVQTHRALMTINMDIIIINAVVGMTCSLHLICMSVRTVDPSCVGMEKRCHRRTLAPDIRRPRVQPLCAYAVYSVYLSSKGVSGSVRWPPDGSRGHRNGHDCDGCTPPVDTHQDSPGRSLTRALANRRRVPRPRAHLITSRSPSRRPLPAVQRASFSLPRPLSIVYSTLLSLSLLSLSPSCLQHCALCVRGPRWSAHLPGLRLPVPGPSARSSVARQRPFSCLLSSDGNSSRRDHLYHRPQVVWVLSAPRSILPASALETMPSRRLRPRTPSHT